MEYKKFYPVVVHQDVILDVLGQPGDLKSVWKYFHHIRHRRNRVIICIIHPNIITIFRQEGHPGRVQQERLMFPLLTCDTYYNPIFYGKYNGNIFIMILRHQDGLERQEGHPDGVSTRETYFPFHQDVLLGHL